MRIARSIAELDLPKDRSIGFVPTMGALHEGHLQLMRRSREEADVSVVSIFVNPLQFGPTEDFARYPRDLDADAEMAESVGVDVVYAPDFLEIYPNSESTIVSVPVVTRLWEGAHRPGHFDGVSTVVAKLFNIVSPDIAFFGRKDFQQCMVIQRMIQDLNMRIRLSIEPTVRESDGLAMSSRNRYLSASERAIASKIFETLSSVRNGLLSGEIVGDKLVEGEQFLTSLGFSIDYLAYVSNTTLAPLSKHDPNSSLIFAGKLGITRLIDNIAVC